MAHRPGVEFAFLPRQPKNQSRLNTITARTYHLIDLDDYVQGHSVTAGPLVDWIVGQVDVLREQLRPLKK